MFHPGSPESVIKSNNDRINTLLCGIIKDDFSHEKGNFLNLIPLDIFKNEILPHIHKDYRNVNSISKYYGQDTLQSISFATFKGDLNALSYFIDLIKYNSEYDIYETNLTYMKMALTAAEFGYIHILKYIIDEKLFSLREVSYQGNTLAHRAAGNNQVKCLKFLIDFGCNFDIPNFKSETPIYEAIKNNNIECVKILIENKCILDIQTITGKSNVHLAVSNGNLKILKILINANSNLDLQDDEGNTPAHLGFIYGCTKCLGLLKKANCNFSIENNAELIPEQCTVEFLTLEKEMEDDDSEKQFSDFNIEDHNYLFNNN